jgi:hypothetical protein
MGVELKAPQKKPTPPPLYFSSNTPVLLTSGSLAPPLGPDALWERSRFLSTWEESLETNNSDQGKL